MNKLTKALLHWIPTGRSGGFRFVLFPDADELGYEKHNMPRTKYRKLKSRQNMAKMSRKKNRK